MLKKINNFIIKNNSSFKLNDILKNIYIIENEEDYLKYIKKNNNTDFKVLGELTNTIINPDVINKINLLFFKDNKKREDITFLENGTIIVAGNIKLKFLCTELLKKQYDCSYLIGIPGTIASAVVNNTGSGKLGKSILDNVLKVEYYIKDKKYTKSINNILYSYRNTEFKFMNNIFISKIYLTFNIINKATLLSKIKKRYSNRISLNEIYKNPSLGTFYIKNNFLNYSDIISKNISIINNKIINYGSKTSYKDYLNFKKKINPLYEIEIEEVNKKYKNDYTGILIIDKNNNILLQKRDNNAYFNKNSISLFGGAVETNEGIKEALIREIKEELNINLNNFTYTYNGLFLKNYDFYTQRCFIFKMQVDDLNNFIKGINCMEGSIFISNLKNIKDIINNDMYTYILKKVLIYNFNF